MHQRNQHRRTHLKDRSFDIFDNIRKNIVKKTPIKQLNQVEYLQFYRGISMLILFKLTLFCVYFLQFIFIQTYRQLYLLQGTNNQFAKLMLNAFIIEKSIFEQLGEVVNQAMEIRAEIANYMLQKAISMLTQEEIARLTEYAKFNEVVPETKMHKCEFCDKHFRDGRQLGGHVSRVHKSQKSKAKRKDKNKEVEEDENLIKKDSHRKKSKKVQKKSQKNNRKRKNYQYQSDYVSDSEDEEFQEDYSSEESQVELFLLNVNRPESRSRNQNEWTDNDEDYDQAKRSKGLNNNKRQKTSRSIAKIAQPKIIADYDDIYHSEE